MIEEQHVFIVDDDADIRDSLKLLLESAGLRSHLYGSAREFLADGLPKSGCVIADVRMPDMSGLELQEEIVRRDAHLPVIIITAHADVPLAVRAMKAGAIDFIEKPFRDQEMLEVVAGAIRTWKPSGAGPNLLAELRIRYGTLTAREREVMALVCKGRMNKQIAGVLDIQQTTVKFHRSAVMTKMKASSLAELTRMAALLEQPA